MRTGSRSCSGSTPHLSRRHRRAARGQIASPRAEAPILPLQQRLGQCVNLRPSTSTRQDHVPAGEPSHRRRRRQFACAESADGGNAEIEGQLHAGRRTARRADEDHPSAVASGGIRVCRSSANYGRGGSRQRYESQCAAACDGLWDEVAADIEGLPASSAGIRCGPALCARVDHASMRRWMSSMASSLFDDLSRGYPGPADSGKP